MALICHEGVASAAALHRELDYQGSPLVDDILEPLAQTAWAGRVEEQGPVSAAVEEDAGARGLGNARNHNDLVPIVLLSQRCSLPCFALRRAWIGIEADHLHVVYRPVAWLVTWIRENQVGRVSGTGQGETLLYSRSRATEDDDGVRAPRGVGSGPDEEDGGQHQEQRDQRGDGKEDDASPPVPGRPH